MGAHDTIGHTLLEELEAPLANRHRVADALPYQFIGQVANISLVHLLEDQSFGIGFEMAVPAVESTPGAEDYVAKVLDQIIRKLPAGYVIQWYRKNSTDVSDYLDLYQQQTSDDLLGRSIADAVVDRWQKASKVGFFPKNPALNFFPCREEMAVMIKSPPSKVFNFSVEQAWALLADHEAPSKKYTEAAKAFSNVVREIRETAAAGGRHMIPMGADGFIPFVVTMLAPNGKRRSQVPQYTGIETISEAISAAVEIDLSSPDGKARTDGFTVIRDGERSCHRVVSMIWQPKAVEAGMCNELMYKHPNITLITTVQMLPQLLEGIKLKAAQYLQSKTVTVFNADEAAEKDKSFKDINRRLFAGEKICLLRFQALVVSGDDAAADDAALRIQSAMDTKFESSTEMMFGSSLGLLGSLPFTASDSREKMFKRQRRMMSRDIADMIAAGGRWTGVVPTPQYLSIETNRRKPIVMYSNAIGGPLFVNPHQCEANPHVLVAGGSGSGKTFFIQDLHLQMWRIPDIRAYLISIKPDYRRLSQMLGKYVEIDLDNEDISINPLGGEPKLSNQAVWTQAVCLMISDGDPNERPNRDERVLIEEAVMAAARKNWDFENKVALKETILSDVVAELLKDGGDLGKILANRLKPYYAGPFKNLINRPRTIQKDDKFIFFNLAGVRKSSCCAVVMFSLFTFIDAIMYDPTLVGVPKVVTYDEGWAVMGDQYSAALMENSARAYRSLGGMAIFISQSFADFDSDLGRAILANTATKIVLPQEQSELGRLPNYIDLNPLEFAAIRDLKLQKRHYSEFFVKMQGLYSTTGRVIPDALKYAIATTDALDEELHARLLVEAGGDYRAAIMKFATQYPFGNKLA
jgi:conjugal transfer ATP-binding protein TraC